MHGYKTGVCKKTKQELTMLEKVSCIHMYLMQHEIHVSLPHQIRVYAVKHMNPSINTWIQCSFTSQISVFLEPCKVKPVKFRPDSITNISVNIQWQIVNTSASVSSTMYETLTHTVKQFILISKSKKQQVNTNTIITCYL